VGLKDGLAALTLMRADPGLGGIWLRDRDGALAETLIDEARRVWGEVRSVPACIDDQALLGGMDIAASLGAGHAVRRRGLIEAAAGALLVIRGAERIPAATAALLASGIERGAFALLLLDESAGEETPPSILLERVAFHLRADGADDDDADLPTQDGDAPDLIEVLAGTAALLGIDSVRAMNLSLRAARTAAGLDGRTEMQAPDAVLAARLVLAPRATRFPAPEEQPPPEAEQQPEPSARERLEDVVLEAARAALPADLLEHLANQRRRGPATRARGAGERRRSPSRGRPLGARSGLPQGGARLALIETIRAAAPWQKLRGGGTAAAGSIRLRRDDLRVKRFEDRAESLTIFAVDASGSSAAARLAEAKGAVELLLGRAHAKRAEVALIAFRGTAAELLLPPTRSLTRARRLLAELPGGGGTPLAAGLDAAWELAESARKRGRTPSLLLLTDGRANVGLDGSAGRAGAEADAIRSARRIGAAGLGGTVIDIGKRAAPDAARIAEALRMPCLYLPRADAGALGAVLG
jgi:magnesium chelatase subunit D